MKSLEVYLSPLAEQKLLSLLEYLEAHWGLKTKTKFLQKFEKSIEIISKFPNSSIEIEEFKGIRKCFVTKQTSFFYRINEHSIEIITVFDNRQDPNSILKEIS